MKQAIPLKSIHNARELGGYQTADGKAIKKGVLLRTSALNGMSDEDIQTLKETYRLQHIIDFRLTMEMMQGDDPQIDGAAYHHLDVIDLSGFPVQNADALDSGSLDLEQIVKLSERFGFLDEKMYLGFLESDTGKKAFAEFFRILLEADPDRAVLWHCTSGKDRTGLAAMLLLSAFGVDEATVISDYLLTNEYNAQKIAGTRQYLKAKGYEDSFINKAVIVFDSVDERFMRNAIEYLKKEYGSVNNYLLDGLKLTPQEIDLIKDKYLV